MSMTRILVILALVMSVALGAQGHPGMQHDPDKTIQGGGKLPSGWQARLDQAAAKIENVKIEAMGNGLHFTSGPAGIYYRPADKASGAYQAHATFTQLEPAMHPEAYGLFIGGADLAGDSQKYTYFLIRQDGKFLIKRRAGMATPTVANWADNAAIKKADASGKMTNMLAVDIGKDTVRFLVNGVEVASEARPEIDADGIAGVRINHNLNVSVESFEVKPRSS